MYFPGIPWSFLSRVWIQIRLIGRNIVGAINLRKPVSDHSSQNHASVQLFLSYMATRGSLSYLLMIFVT